MKSSPRKIHEMQSFPLEFSAANYKKNEITESLFAGSLHCGYPEPEKEEDSAGRETVQDSQQFSSWRELFQAKMTEEDPNLF